MQRLMLGFFLIGCAAGADVKSDIPGCDLTIRLNSMTRVVGLKAISRINKATGCSLHESEFGAPLEIVPEAIGSEGLPVCGTTAIARGSKSGEFKYIQSIKISTDVPGCNSQEAVVVHELFHGMIATNGIHSDDGVFHIKGGNGELINASTLETVCSHMVCPIFQPEN